MLHLNGTDYLPQEIIEALIFEGHAQGTQVYTKIDLEHLQDLLDEVNNYSGLIALNLDLCPIEAKELAMLSRQCARRLFPGQAF